MLRPALLTATRRQEHRPATARLGYNSSPMSAFDDFHPAVRAWFTRSFEAPTPAQLAGWDAIAQGRDTLVAAPTGSGKTLAAFLSTIDALFRKGLQRRPGRAQPGTAGGGCRRRRKPTRGIEIVYVSPLKALSSDIQRNLEAPLSEIRDVAREMGIEPPEIKTALRTGDTTQAQRAAILRDVPHILITTPESLYLMVTAERSRKLLGARADGHRRRAALRDARQARQPPDADAGAARRALRYGRIAAAGAGGAFGDGASDRGGGAIPGGDAEDRAYSRGRCGSGADGALVTTGHSRGRL